MSSRVKQVKLFDDHHLAVQPEQFTFGLEIAGHTATNHIVSENFQYVAVEKHFEYFTAVF